MSFRSAGLTHSSSGVWAPRGCREGLGGGGESQHPADMNVNMDSPRRSVTSPQPTENMHAVYMQTHGSQSGALPLRECHGGRTRGRHAGKKHLWPVKTGLSVKRDGGYGEVGPQLIHLYCWARAYEVLQLPQVNINAHAKCIWMWCSAAETTHSAISSDK